MSEFVEKLEEEAPGHLLVGDDEFRIWMTKSIISQNKTLNGILDQATRTNGRVTSLETVTKPIKEAQNSVKFFIKIGITIVAAGTALGVFFLTMSECWKHFKS